MAPKYKVFISEPCPHCETVIELELTRKMAKHLFRAFKEQTAQDAQAYIRRHVKGLAFTLQQVVTQAR